MTNNDKNENEEKRWINSVQISLPKNQNHNQRQPYVAATTTITPVLQLVGLKSSTRTIFARIQHKHIRFHDNKIDDDNNDDDSYRCCCFRVEDILDKVMERIRNDNDDDDDDDDDDESVQEQEQVPSTRTLLELGSVWVLDPSNVDRPKNKPIWKRLLLEENNNMTSISHSSQNSSLLLIDYNMILRIHSRPSRFPVVNNFRLALQQHLQNQKNNDNDNDNENNNNNKKSGDCDGDGDGDGSGSGVIVYESNNDNHDHNNNNNCRDECCFTILNKPCGLPSHATVDNGTENVLYQYQQYQRQISSRGSSSSSSKNQNDFYASLPQRLDTETSGLLIISTSSQFASYICKLLQQKTLTIPPKMISLTSASTDTTSIPVIQKRYKCLVGFNTKEIWDTIKTNYQMCGRIVEHYVDVNSKAPKTFVTAVAPVTTATAPPNDTTTTTTTVSKWLSCRLRILTMTPPISTSSISRSSNSTTTSTSTNVISKFGFVLYEYVAELEIELLTGRTHQIRGQLAALGCPIIRDPLYGGSGSVSGSDSNGNHHQLSLLQQSRGTTHRTVTKMMALQCCQLSFTIDNNNINEKKKNTSKKKKKLLSKMSMNKEGNFNKTVGNATATTTTTGSTRSRDEQQQMTIQILQEECSSNNSSNNSNSKCDLFHFCLDSAWWSDDIACTR
jgi:23S rRNA-/tRNA-specific pseudouridylate synthase